LTSKLLVVESNNQYYNSLLEMIKKYFNVEFYYIQEYKTYLFKTFFCCRTYQNILFDYVINNSFFDNETKKIYSKRHEDGNKLIDFAKISSEYYESALNISRQNKIKDYWKNIWGISNNYNDHTIIENLILR
jgi:hypothetical protein